MNTKRLFIALISCSCCAYANTPTLHTLSWLSGCWQQPLANGSIQEFWTSAQADSLFAINRTIINDKTVGYEFLRITINAENNRLNYIAKPSGQTETIFQQTLLEKDHVVFSNPAHDFPQEISYRRTSKHGMLATVSGKQSGQLRQIQFPFQRTPCP